jgi:hypothetical protein
LFDKQLFDHSKNGVKVTHRKCNVETEDKALVNDDLIPIWKAGWLDLKDTTQPFVPI